MSALLGKFTDFLYTIFTLIANVLSGIGQMVVMIPQALSMLTNTIGYMPTVCMGFAMALVMINIIYMVVDR